MEGDGGGGEEQPVAAHAVGVNVIPASKYRAPARTTVRRVSLYVMPVLLPFVHHLIGGSASMQSGKRTLGQADRPMQRL